MIVEMDLIIGVRAILLVVIILCAAGMAARLIYAFTKISLGQKLFLAGSLSMTIYSADAMRAAIQAGLEWKPRLIAAFIGAACLFGWNLEPLALQRRLWGRQSFIPPPDLLQDATSDTERQLNWIGQVADYAIFALALDGTILTWNKGAEKLKGYTAQEALGKNFSMFYTPEDQELDVPRRLLDMAAGIGRVERTGWRVRKDGTRFWGDVVITLVRDHEGRAIGFVKIVRDLSTVPKPPSGADSDGRPHPNG